MSGMSTATILSLGLSAAGTAVGFAGQLQQQQTKQQAVAATAAQAVYQSQVARQNEEVMKRRADEALRQGRAAEENSRRLTNQRIGAQTARLAAQGTDLEGSPADILGDTAAAGEVDSLALRAKAAREAYDYQVAAVGYGNTGVLETTRALNTADSSPYLGAGASLLSGASMLADKWRNFELNNGRAL
ncbi:MAG: virion core protein, T7 gp14 family [Reyranella sp.]